MTAGPVALEADFAERLARAAGPGVTVQHVEVMPGGHSGLTHRAQLDGLPGHHEVIVKSTPPGRNPRGRHDVLRQARILRALAPISGVPVPEVCFEDATEPPFFAAACVAGEAVDPAIAEDDATYSAELVARRWGVAIDVLAALHALDPAELGLADEPARAPGEELELWCATMGAAGMDEDPEFRRLSDVMHTRIPSSGRASLVHGDFRLGNILFVDDVPEAVIDWEIWSIGEPLVDLAWFVQFTDGENFPGVGRNVPGTPSATEVLDRYTAAAGTGRDRSQTDWFFALGCLKLAAIQAHNRRRHLDGRFHDPYQALLGPSIDRHLSRGLETLA